ncbi:hypothetical protein HK104_005882 [Borealophlyctis nickersoniae]|nr:hypothetical protein HK104_005882 [Borealophlyctis nickersoniae]
MDKMNTATLSVSNSEPSPSTPTPPLVPEHRDGSSTAAAVAAASKMGGAGPVGGAAAGGNGGQTMGSAHFTTSTALRKTAVGAGGTTPSLTNPGGSTAARRMSFSSPLGFTAHIITRKSKSVAFFVELVKSDGSSASSRQSSRMRLKYSRLGFIQPFVRAAVTSSGHSPEETSRRLTARLMRAQLRRAMLLHDRRMRLRRRAEQVRYRIILQRQRERLRSLKIRARSEYAISAANLKRELILKKNVERCGAAVEHAQTVAMMQKLRKYMALRRAFSQNFADLLEETAGEGLGDWAGRGLEDEEYELDEVEVRAPSYSHMHGQMDHPHAHLRTLRREITEYEDQVVDKSSVADTPMETALSPRRSTSAPELHHAALYSDNDDEDDSDDDSLSEPLSTSIRRLRMLPTHIFEDADEATFTQLIPLLPPITRFTLRELDLSEILASAQVRHDLYFDPNLAFKPDDGGDAGKAKEEKTEAYWAEIAEEIGRGDLWRVPLFLFEIRCIITELLPYEKERAEELERNLDVKLIAQEMKHGVLNVGGLIGYLANLFRSTCAPARDESVYAMAAAAGRGEFAKTLRLCFELLELMRLDSANDQLRRVRPYVIEHAAEFEWRWFKDHVEAGTFSIAHTKAWFESAISLSRTAPPPASTSSAATPPSSTPPPTLVHIHTNALLKLISSATSFGTIPLPETLRMDTYRLINTHNDWQDITIMACVLLLFRQACGAKCTPADVAEAKRVYWVLLNDSDTSMDHVCVQMVADVGRVRGKPVADSERAMISGVLERTLASDSKVYQMVQGRVGDCLKGYCNGQVVGRDGLVKWGLGDLEAEIADLGERVRRLAEHNRRVYGGLYRVILEKFEEGVNV